MIRFGPTLFPCFSWQTGYFLFVLERIMYARKAQDMQRNPVIGGVPITEEQAMVSYDFKGATLLI